MTDGVLDVPDSEAYGRNLGDPARTAQARNAAAVDRIPVVLDDLRSINAQVWPLGFGRADVNQLGRFSAGTPCAPSVPSPAARVITDPAQLTPALLDAFQSATCVRVDPGGSATVDPGATDVEIPVQIPEIASNSAILVEKRDARIQVQYVDPSGDVVSGGTSGESSFSLSGQGTTDESLRITLPEPGTWKVRLSSPADVPAQDVTARVVHQLAVSTVIGLDPPLPAAGQDVGVTMQLRSRRGAVNDPKLLEGLTFTAVLGVNGSPGDPVTLAPAENGVHSGALKVPAAAVGDLSVTGTVSGLGIGGASQVYSTRVRPGTAEVVAQMVLRPAGPTVEAGGEIPGQASVTNSSGRPRTLRIVLADPVAGLGVDPATITAAPGSSTVPFALRFAADAPLGAAGGRLQLIDDDGSPVAERVLATTVVQPPSAVERVARDYWWVLVAVSVLVAGLVAWLLARARAARRASQVRGLRVELYRQGAKVHELSPRRPESQVFRFVVHHDGFTDPQLQEAAGATGGEPPFELRRGKDGLTLTPEGPAGPQVHPNEPRPLSGSLSLVVVDNAPTPGSGTGYQPTQSWGPGSPSWDGSGHADAQDPAWTAAPTGTSGGAGDDWSNSDPWDSAAPLGDNSRTVSTRVDQPSQDQWGPSGGGSPDPGNPYDPWR